ncbi:MAG: lysozyme [Candidatus Arsenophonus phytopathogenicus]
MYPTLRKRLIAATAGGTVAIAAVLIQWHEGIRHKPYKDGGGVTTVCYGNTEDVVHGKEYSKEECDSLLMDDLNTALETIERKVTVPLTATQKAALASFVYNVGSGAFTRSTLLKKLNAGDTQGACNEMRRWKYDEGKVSKGLVNRREVERELCLNQKALINPTQ